MKRVLVISTIVAAMALGLAPGAAADAGDQAVVNVVPVVRNASERATVTLTDNGLTVTAMGTGVNFDPFSEYVSLMYGLQSVPVTTNGVPPCADDGTLGAPAEATARMFLGAWLPIVGTQRALVGVNALTGLEEVRTVSIRRAGGSITDPGTILLPGDVRPKVFQIRSCGLINVTRGS